MNIIDITYVIPNHHVLLSTQQDFYGLNKNHVAVFNKIFGLNQINFASNYTNLDLIEQSIDKLLINDNFNLSEVKLIIYAHTINDSSPFAESIPNKIRNKYGFLNDVIFFSMTATNCASPIAAMKIIKNFFDHNEDENSKSLLLISDIAFTSAQRIIPNTTILSDGACAILFGKNQINHALMGVDLKHNGQSSQGIWMNDIERLEFEKSYASDFSELIKNVLNKANLNLENIKFIIPHNVNIPSWVKIGRLLNYDIKQIFLKNIDKIAHCFGSDIFINLSSVINSGILNKDDYYILATSGLGSTYAAAIFQY